MSSPQIESYDQFPYKSRCVPQAHPDNLAACAMLRGLSSARTEACRVLELGCASGGNLIPLAANFPSSQFVGVDRSARQIEQARHLVGALSLTNIELRAQDLMDLADDVGLFDYIIVHGVYSWVSPAVQARVLQICQRHLAPHGVAFISYNAYPGFYRRQPIMDMMRYHVAGMQTGGDPAQIVRHGRALLSFLQGSQNDPDGTMARLLREEEQRIAQMPDSYIFHEHFEADNRPCYFHEFMAAADAHGLRYVGDAQNKLGLEGLSGGAQQVLQQLEGDEVRQEQYVDFVRSTALRSSILCRKEVTLTRGAVKAPPDGVWVLTDARPESAADLAPERVRGPAEVKFRSAIGTATLEHPEFKSMLVALHTHRPGAMQLPDLTVRASEILGAPVALSDITDMVMYGFRSSLVMLRSALPPLALTLSDRPCASALARIMAPLHGEVPSQWHETVVLSPFEQTLLPLLDGTRDQGALHGALLAAVASGALRISGPGGVPIRDPERASAIVTHHLPGVLLSFLRSGLLTG